MDLKELLHKAAKTLSPSALLRLVHWVIMKQYRDSVTVASKQGIFTLPLSDWYISRSLYCHGHFELDLFLETIELLRGEGLCPPKGQGGIMDIGANNGVISIGALHTEEFANAVAIEPDPQNFSLLLHNVAQNGMQDRIFCLPYAVSDQAGELQFELSDTNFGDHRVRLNDVSQIADADRYQESKRRVITVRSQTLDTLLAQVPEAVARDIAVIWIDVQGHEGYVFQGARDLLRQGVPVVSEIWPYGIRRAGMSQVQFCEIARGIWSSYWVVRNGRYVRHPISTLELLFQENRGVAFENVVFTP